MAKDAILFPFSSQSGYTFVAEASLLVCLQKLVRKFFISVEINSHLSLKLIVFSIFLYCPLI